MKVPSELVDLYSRLQVRDKNIVVMFSGGPDSVYMLETLRACGAERVTLWYINYTNTPAAPEWQKNLKFVMDYAYKNNLSMYVHTVDIRKDYSLKKGPEGNCRMAKKDVINALMADPLYDYVFVGHNLDDHVETILIQLMRGAGRGSRGIPDVERGKLIRPLIRMKKADILDNCREAQLNWFEDPINEDTKGTRVFFRNEIIPKLVEHYGPGAYSRISNIGKKFEELMGDDKPDGTAA